MDRELDLESPTKEKKVESPLHLRRKVSLLWMGFKTKLKIEREERKAEKVV